MRGKFAVNVTFSITSGRRTTKKKHADKKKQVNFTYGFVRTRVYIRYLHLSVKCHFKFADQVFLIIRSERVDELYVYTHTRTLVTQIILCPSDGCERVDKLPMFK